MSRHGNCATACGREEEDEDEDKERKRRTREEGKRGQRARARQREREVKKGQLIKKRLGGSGAITDLIHCQRRSEG